MARMNEKQKLLTIAGVSLVLTLGAGGGVYWAKGLVQEEAQAIEQKQTQISAAEKKIEKIRGVEDEVIILRENLDEYVKILPNNSEVEEFVQALYTFSSQTGVRTESVKPGRTRGKDAGGFSKVTYEYAMEATLWQALEFMNLIESYDRFIKVTKFELQSKDGNNVSDADKVNGDIRHVITMAFETYVYEGGKGGKGSKGAKGELVIPKYAFKRDALKERIFESRQSIQIESYEFRGPLSRRDIFTDPRVNSNSEEDYVPVAGQEEIIKKHMDQVAQIQQVYDRMTDTSVTMMESFRLQRMMGNDLGVLEAGIGEVNERGMISFRPYEVRWNKEVELPTLELRKKYDEFVEGTVGQADNSLDLVTLTTLHESMVRYVRTGNLDEAIRSFEDVQDKLNVPADDARFQLVLDVTTLHKKAIVAKEFQRLRLDIQGVVVREDGRSGVLLNDQVLEEGDYVGPECFVKKVMSEQVAFVYRGLTLIKTF